MDVGVKTGIRCYLIHCTINQRMTVRIFSGCDVQIENSVTRVLLFSIMRLAKGCQTVVPSEGIINCITIPGHLHIRINIAQFYYFYAKSSRFAATKLTFGPFGQCWIATSGWKYCQADNFVMKCCSYFHQPPSPQYNTHSPHKVILFYPSRSVT